MNPTSNTTNKTKTHHCWSLLLLLLLIGCGHAVDQTDSGNLPEATDDNVELEDTAVAFLQPTGKWRMVLVNRENSKYLKPRKTQDKIYRASSTFDPHLRNYHSFCDKKVILNRDMQQLVSFMRQSGYFEYAEEFDENDLLRGKWGEGAALVLEQAGTLYRMPKRPTQGNEMNESDLARRKCYVDIKSRMLMISRNYKHYEVKQGTTSPTRSNEPVVKPKYRDQLKNKKPRE